MNFKCLAAAGAVFLMPAALHAQEEPDASTEATIGTDAAESQTVAAAGSDKASASPEAAAPAAIAADCELHVWATHNYLGFNSGLLSGFGLVGVVADQAAHQGRVKTVKDLMRDYLGPDVQLAQLDEVGYRKILGKESYRVIVEEPTPFNEDLKNNPELKAQVKALNAKIKSGERLTASKNACYAEMLVTFVMYHKAMMYGSNLFTGILFRDFSSGKLRQSAGSVKNPLEDFPPKTAETVDRAQEELRDAFRKDFVEWSQKKLAK